MLIVISYMMFRVLIFIIIMVRLCVILSITLVMFIHALTLLAVGRQFTVQNPNELYVLVSSALPTTRRDMTCTVLKAT